MEITCTNNTEAKPVEGAAVGKMWARDGAWCMSFGRAIAPFFFLGSMMEDYMVTRLLYSNF
jgi:hypothetical protein